MKQKKYLEDTKLSIALFLFLFLLYAIVYMTKTMFTSAMAIIVEEGFMTKSQTGLINAVFWLVYAPFQVVGGFAADRYSSYKLILLGLAGAAISNLIIYMNQNYYVMMSAWIFNAIAQFGLWPGVFKIISTQTAPKMREKFVFWVFFATSIGFGLSMLITSFVTHWKHNFLVSLISLLVMMIAYVPFHHFLDQKMVESKSDSQENGKQAEEKKEPMIPLLFTSGLIVFLIVCLLRGAIDNGIKMMTPVMLMESYETLPAAISTRISSVLILFSAIGTFVAGYVQSKVTKNEAKAQILLYTASLLPLIVVGFLGSIHYLWILIALCVSVMLLHGAAPFSQSFAALHFRNYGRIGTVSGILNATASIGNVLASYVFAKMAELMPWRSVTASWLITIVACGLLCAAVLPRWTRFTKE